MQLEVIIGQTECYTFDNVQASPLEELFQRLRDSNQNQTFIYNLVEKKDNPRLIEALSITENIHDKRLELRKSSEPQINNYNGIREIYHRPQKEVITITNSGGYIEVLANSNGTYDIFNVKDDNREHWKDGQELSLDAAIGRLYPIIHSRKQGNLKTPKKKCSI